MSLSHLRLLRLHLSQGKTLVLVEVSTWEFLVDTLHWIGLDLAHVLNLSLKASELPNNILTHFFCVMNKGSMVLCETPPHTEIANVRCDSNSV